MNREKRVRHYLRKAVEHNDDYAVRHWFFVNAVLAACPDQSLGTLTRIDEVMDDHLACGRLHEPSPAAEEDVARGPGRRVRPLLVADHRSR
jgi:hypothetical protein